MRKELLGLATGLTLIDHWQDVLVGSCLGLSIGTVLLGYQVDLLCHADPSA